MQENLFQQGLELMIYGMGTVFVFLVVLIAVTVMMSIIVRRFFPDEPEPIVPATPVPAGSSESNNEQLVAIITGAVHQYRSRHKQ